MVVRKLLKHELEDKVIELESELNSWKQKYLELNEEYKELDEENNVLLTKVDLLDRIENKIDSIHNRVNEFQKPTITGFIFTVMDRIFFNKPIVTLTNFNDNVDDESDSYDESDSDSVIEPPSPCNT